MKTLFLLTARGESKSIPDKNIKPLLGKPLIHYSIEYARLFVGDKDICLSTDSDVIIKTARQINYETPFVRPSSLATDHSGSYEVIVHAINFYKEKGFHYDNVVLLQPTSPYRIKMHLEEAFTLYSIDIDMVVSVSETYLYHHYEEKNGLLVPFGQVYQRRQDAKSLYKHNGSIYIINTKSLSKYNNFDEFTRIRKYVMGELFSIDIDTVLDWEVLESIMLKNKL